jgi:hypothetical protein
MYRESLCKRVTLIILAARRVGYRASSGPDGWCLNYRHGGVVIMTDTMKSLSRIAVLPKVSI